MTPHLLRRVSIMLCALCCGLFLSNCDMGGGKGRVTVRFWNGFTGPDGRTMLRLVKRFNRENPDVHVLMQRMDWGTYYNKLFVAGIGERAPDIFIVHADTLERFLRADFVREVDDLVKGANGITESDFYENVWKAVEKDGKHYGVPLDVHCLGVYYNRKLLRQAGVTDAAGNPSPPRTRDEFLDALRKIRSSGRGQDWGFVYTWFRTNVYTIMCQYGGRFFTDDMTRCIMNTPENVEALQFCADLIHKEHLAPSPENFDSWIGFRQGKVGIVFEGIYMLADLQKQKDLDWAASTVPLLGPQPAAWANSHTMCLRGDLEGERLAAAWRFVKFLSDNSLDWAEGGQIPVRKSLRETDRFRAMTSQYEFSKQLPIIRYMPRVPFIFEYQTEFDLAIEKALRGSATAQEALDGATKRVNEIIERQREIEASAERPGDAGGLK